MTLKIRPITGNDIFGPTATLPTVDEDPESESDPLMAASPPPVTSLPYFPPLSHSIEDDDFQPDPVEHALDPPQASDPPDCYPSMEISDSDGDEDEDDNKTEGEGEAPGDGPDLEEFMDWEYLKQGNHDLQYTPYHIRG